MNRQNRRRLRFYTYMIAVAGVLTMSAAEGPGVGLATGLLVLAGFLALWDAVN